MQICLFGASADCIDKKYIDETFTLGEKIADYGHSLIYGGGALGLMGAAAKGVLSHGGKVTGVAPSFFQVDGALLESCTEMIFTDTMRERKKRMEDGADAFIIVPGGPGTFDEFFEIMTLKQLGQHTKAIVFYNINGYFDPLLLMLENAVKQRFMPKECLSIFSVFDDPDALLQYLEGYLPMAINVRKMRNLSPEINEPV